MKLLKDMVVVLCSDHTAGDSESILNNLSSLSLTTLMYLFYSSECITSECCLTFLIQLKTTVISLCLQSISVFFRILDSQKLIIERLWKAKIS